MPINHLYMLTFPNGKLYVGITNNFANRMSSHRRGGAKPHMSQQSVLHSAIAKHGWENIDKKVIITGPREYIMDMEIKIIAEWRLRHRDFGYNVTLGGNTSPTLCPDVAARVGRANKGKVRTAEHRAKISNSLIGHSVSDTTRRKIGASSYGTKHSPEHIEKIRLAGMGRKHSDESRLKMRESMRGIAKSTDHKAKLSAALSGKVRTPAREETKTKISVANKAAWARRKSLKVDAL